MRFIYFHIDERDRDLFVARAISKSFKNKNVKVFFGTRKTNKIVKYFHWVFDVFIFPRPHFFSDYYGSMINNWQSKIVCLPTENIGAKLINKSMFVKSTLEIEFFNSKNKNRLPDLQFVWGKKQYDFLKNTFPSEIERFIVSGHPRYDGLSKIKPIQISNKPNIILLSRANGLNDYLFRNPLLFLQNSTHQFLNKLLGNIEHPLNCIDKSQRAFTSKLISAQVIDFVSLIEAIEIIQKNRDKFGRVEVRPHPKENIKFWKEFIEKYKGSIILDKLSIPLVQKIQQFDYCISPPSTSFYDCVRVGCVPVSTESMSKDRPNFKGLWSEDNNALSKITLKPKSKEDLLSILITKNNKVDLKYIEKVLREECNYPKDQNSIQKIVDVLYQNFNSDINLSLKKLLIYKLIVIVKILYVKLYFQLKKRNSSSDIVIDKCEF